MDVRQTTYRVPVQRVELDLGSLVWRHGDGGVVGDGAVLPGGLAAGEERLICTLEKYLEILYTGFFPRSPHFAIFAVGIQTAKLHSAI